MNKTTMIFLKALLIEEIGHCQIIWLHCVWYGSGKNIATWNSYLMHIFMGYPFHTICLIFRCVYLCDENIYYTQNDVSVPWLQLTAVLLNHGCCICNNYCSLLFVTLFSIQAKEAFQVGAWKPIFVLFAANTLCCQVMMMMMMIMGQKKPINFHVAICILT